MCVAPGPGDACDNYETDWQWMDRSGNACWGMGADRLIPCLNCGVERQYHFSMWVGDISEDSSDNGTPT